MVEQAISAERYFQEIFNDEHAGVPIRIGADDAVDCHTDGRLGDAG